MSKENLIKTLYQIGAIQFGEFKLKSGQLSSIYINLRKIISYPTVLRATADIMWQAVKDCQFDLICGVPYTALPIATCISLQQDIPMILRRKEKKDYGTKQMIEGEYKNGQLCLIIEDVITTGSSIFETADDLEAASLITQNVVVLVDREQGGKSNLAKKFNVHAILSLSLIMDTLLASTLISNLERETIHQFARSA